MFKNQHMKGPTYIIYKKPTNISHKNRDSRVCAVNCWAESNKSTTNETLKNRNDPLRTNFDLSTYARKLSLEERERHVVKLLQIGQDEHPC